MDCNHALRINRDPKNPNKTAQNGSPPKGEEINRQVCRCGAVRVDRQIGLESTFEEFISRLVEVFSEVRRVLKNNGTLWVNMGDSYNGATSGNPNTLGKRYGKTKAHAGVDRPCRKATGVKRDLQGGLKPKDLMGQPWRLAFALQAAGWYLRQDIIWHKPNPMPESIQDRCTKAHEYVFLLSKSERYFYDQAAIREPVTGNSHARGSGVNRKVAGWMEGPGSHSAIDHARAGTAFKNGPRPKQNASFSAAVKDLVDDRNKRSVWTVPTFPFPEAHFATYPPDLIRPCILAGSRPGDVVMDIFGGSGTTAEVALEHGRQAVLIELNPEYIPLIHQRCEPSALEKLRMKASRAKLDPLPLFGGEL